MALWDLPQHGYYNAPKYKQEKKDNGTLALNVCQELHDTVIPRVEKNVKRCERKLQDKAASTSTSGNPSSSSTGGGSGNSGSSRGSRESKNSARITHKKDVSAADLKGIKERIIEAKLLLDVAKEHVADLEPTSRDATKSKKKSKYSTTSSNSNSNSNSKNSSSKSSTSDLSPSSSWVQSNVSRILDCSESVSSSLCPGGSGGTNMSLGRVPEEEQVLIKGLSPSRSQLQKKYGVGKTREDQSPPPPLEFERSNSAPPAVMKSASTVDMMTAKPKKTSSNKAVKEVTKSKEDETRRNSNSSSTSNSSSSDSNPSRPKRKEKKQRKGQDKSKQLTKVPETKIKSEKATTDKEKEKNKSDRSKSSSKKGAESKKATSRPLTPNLKTPSSSSSSSESKESRKSSKTKSSKASRKTVKPPKDKEEKKKGNETKDEKDNHASPMTLSEVSPTTVQTVPDLIINTQLDDSTASTSSQTSAQTSDEDDDMKLNSLIAPIPHTASSPSDDSDLKRALYLSGLEFQTQSSTRNQMSNDVYPAVTPSNLRRHTSAQLDISTLSELYRQDFEELRRSHMKRINVSYINTYQGRARETVNGCTVIAPLLAIQFLKGTEMPLDRNPILSEGINHKRLITDDPFSERKDSEDVLPSPPSMHDLMLSASTIEAVIDVQTQLVLPKVREHLGLHQDALIIPSDVHDYLYEHKFLSPEQYVDVCGGNILDDKHLDKFIEALSPRKPIPKTKATTSKQSTHSDSEESCDDKESDVLKEDFSVEKIAATFFFHEHVVCIHRVTRKTDTSIIDHLKSSKKAGKKGFFRRIRGNKKVKLSKEAVTEKRVTKEETWFEIIDSMPNSLMLRNSDDKKRHWPRSEGRWLTATARMCCTDVDSLKACLRWYACSKLSDEDRKFINSYQWDDGNFNFDPRVFQSFLWSV